VRQVGNVEEATNRIGRGHLVARSDSLASHPRLAGCRSGRRVPAASHRGLPEINDEEEHLEEVGSSRAGLSGSHFRVPIRQTKCGAAAAPRVAYATPIVSLSPSRPTK